MGDRADIELRFPAGPPDVEADDAASIHIYTHWGGYRAPLTLRDGLIRGRPRWSDAPYLARIIFGEFVKDDVLGELGYGLSPRFTDTEYAPLICDLGAQTVTVGQRAYSFREYVQLADDDPGLEAAWMNRCEQDDDDDERA